MKSLFLLTLLSFLCSCTDDNQKEADGRIVNAWYLNKYEPGFSPIEYFEDGQIIWTFNSNGSLQIEVDSSIENPPLKSSGEYVYSVDGNLIMIDNLTYDYAIKSNSMTISDDPSSDGFRLSFILFKN